MLRGIDVSALADWATLKAQYNLSFGFARCQRQPGVKDSAFDANWSRMGGVLDVRGAYEFALPSTLPVPDPAVRARNSWTWFSAAGLQPSDLFCLDLEVSPVGQDETNAWAKAWFDEWERVADRPPGIYLGSSYLLNRTGDGLRDYGFNWLWFPRYPSSQLAWPTTFNPQPLNATWPDTNWGSPPEFWQFFGTNSASTITFDGDVFNGTLTDLKTLNQRNSNVLIGLTLGNTGNAVRELQAQLALAGFYTGSVDGVYDADVSAAVLACRKSQGSAATSGDTIDQNAYRQIFTAVILAKGVPGPKGDKGDPGADSTVPGPQGEIGPMGPAGADGRTPTKVGIRLDADVTEVI